MGQDPFQAFDRQGERGDVVVVEDAGGDEGPQGLAAAIGQEGDLPCEVSRQLIKGPAELVEPAGDPFQAILMLAANLLGDDPVLPGRTDIVEVGLHQRSAAMPAGAVGSGNPRYSTSKRPAARAIP